MFWSRARTVLLSCATYCVRHEERESPRLAAPESQPRLCLVSLSMPPVFIWCSCVLGLGLVVLCPSNMSGVPVPALCLHAHDNVFSSNGNLVCWACAFPQWFQKASRVFPVLFAAQVAERRRWKFRNRTPLP